MFRVSLSLAMLAAAALPAAAQPTPAPTPSAGPVAAPSTCAVDLVRVPDDVRPVIQEWVDAEPRCIVTLSVRVLPTEGGLYVLATEPSGRTRERIVPDALTAAVLIASWVADDGAVLATPAPTAPIPAPEVVTPAPIPPAPARRPAQVAPPGAIGAEAGLVAPASSGSRRAIGFGWTFNQRGVGLRVDLDWRRLGGLQLGLVAQAFRSEEALRTDGSDGELGGRDFSAMVQAAYIVRRGRFELRGSIAAGVTLSNAEGSWMEDSVYKQASLNALSPSGEIAATFGVWFGPWAARAGVATLVMPGTLESTTGGTALEWERGIEPRAYLGATRAW